MTSATLAPKGFSFDTDRGVLVVTLHWDSVVRERALEELQHEAVAHLPQATTAILFDCRKLTGPATSQFLATLVAVRKSAMRAGLFVCVANLSGPVREAYTVSRLDRIIPPYDDREAAIRAVGDYNLGRIVVGKADQERASASAIKVREAKSAKSSESSATSVFAEQASSAIAAATESLSGIRENIREASQSMSPRQMAQLGGIAAAVVVAVSVASYFLLPPRTLAASSTSDDRPLVFGGDAIATLVGRIEVQSGEVSHADAGALVFAWRVGEGPQQKVLGKTIYRYLNEAVASEKFPHPWMHVARASETGNFRIGIDAPGEFEVLIISAANERSPTLTSGDEATLAQWFAAPRELTGRHPDRLCRQRIEKDDVKLNQVFTRP